RAFPQGEDGIRAFHVTGVQTCALPIYELEMAMSDVIQPGTSGSVQVAYEDKIAVVTLSHPGRLNAITAFMWQELARIFTELSADESLRCVVLRGEGGNFAAGADIS